jgi:hypothetical protein
VAVSSTTEVDSEAQVVTLPGPPGSVGVVDPVEGLVATHPVVGVPECVRPVGDAVLGAGPVGVLPVGAAAGSSGVGIPEGQGVTFLGRVAADLALAEVVRSELNLTGARRAGKALPGSVACVSHPPCEGWPGSPGEEEPRLLACAPETQRVPPKAKVVYVRPVSGQLEELTHFCISSLQRTEDPPLSTMELFPSFAVPSIDPPPLAIEYHQRSGEGTAVPPPLSLTWEGPNWSHEGEFAPPLLLQFHQGGQAESDTEPHPPAP